MTSFFLGTAPAVNIEGCGRDGKPQDFVPLCDTEVLFLVLTWKNTSLSLDTASHNPLGPKREPLHLGALSHKETPSSWQCVGRVCSAAGFVGLVAILVPRNKRGAHLSIINSNTCVVVTDLKASSDREPDLSKISFYLSQQSTD